MAGLNQQMHSPCSKYVAIYAFHTLTVVQWVDKAYATLRPLLSQDVYQNAVDLSLSDWQAAYYGQNYARLVSVKDAYDPLNYFNFPQSLGS